MLDYSFPAVSRFARAARQHHDVAVGLLAGRGRVKESVEAYHAVYVGGYAPECALKAVYLNNVPEADHVGLIDERFKELGHNLYGCYDTVRQQFGKSMPRPLLDRFRHVARLWDVRMRYWPGKRRTADARAFLDTVADVLDWAGVK